MQTVPLNGDYQFDLKGLSNITATIQELLPIINNLDTVRKNCTNSNTFVSAPNMTYPLVFNNSPMTYPNGNGGGGIGKKNGYGLRGKNQQIKDKEPSLLINPKKFKFIPKDRWNKADEFIPIGTLIKNYFAVKGSRNNRFEHKLYNALQITLFKPYLFPIIGAMWATPTIMKVHSKTFGHLLGFSRISSALFASKGCFPSHGFLEVLDNELCCINSSIILTDRKFCRFFKHKNFMFNIGATENDVAACNWYEKRCDEA